MVEVGRVLNFQILHLGALSNDFYQTLSLNRNMYHFVEENEITNCFVICSFGLTILGYNTEYSFTAPSSVTEQLEILNTERDCSLNLSLMQLNSPHIK